MLAAHPDDEVLAVGGWLAGQTERPVTFVNVTDGDVGEAGGSSAAPGGLSTRRPSELLGALSILGFDAPDLRRLRLPHGGVGEARTELVDALRPLVGAADLVLAPFERDGHPDHDAVGAAAVELCGDHTTLWRFPVWTWARTQPAEQTWLPDIWRLDCSSTARVRKRQAIAELQSHVQPLSPRPGVTAPASAVLLRHASYAPEAVVIRP